MVLQDGDRGVVLQRDQRTYAIAPHLPCGVVSPDMLRMIAAVAERYDATLKVTSAQRIALIGLRQQDIDPAWAALGGRPAMMVGSCVRSVRACPGTQFCKRARQDSLAVGLELDKRHAGMPMPGKTKIGVSGCGNDCSETCIRDVGLRGGACGWTVLVGGAGGTVPRLAKDLTESEVSTAEAIGLVEKAIAFYRATAEPGERVGDTLLRVGLNAVRQAVMAG